MAYAALTEADRPRLQALAHLGQTAAAEALEVSPATVGRYGKKWGITWPTLTQAELSAARWAQTADERARLREQEKRAEELARKREAELRADTKRLKSRIFAAHPNKAAKLEEVTGVSLRMWAEKHGHFSRFPSTPGAVPGQRNTHILEDCA